MKYLNFILFNHIILIIAHGCYNLTINTTTIELNQSNFSTKFYKNQNPDEFRHLNKIQLLILMPLIIVFGILFMCLMSGKTEKELELQQRIEELRKYIHVNVIKVPECEVDKVNIVDKKINQNQF